MLYTIISNAIITMSLGGVVIAANAVRVYSTKK